MKVDRFLNIIWDVEEDDFIKTKLQCIKDLRDIFMEHYKKHGKEYSEIKDVAKKYLREIIEYDENNTDIEFLESL